MSATVYPFNFDLAGRMTQRDYRTAANSPAGAIADSDVFTHNNSGQTLTATSGRYNNNVAMTYDVAGRLQDESLTISGQTYTVGNQYDVRGQLWKQTYPSGKVAERLYHDDGQLHQVRFDGSLVDTRLYDDGGRLDNSTYGNGVVTDFTYFDDNNTESITIKDSSQSLIDSFLYAYDANKNVMSETRGGAMSGYSWTTDNGGASGYDADDRLTDWKYVNASVVQNWNLSPVADWNSYTNTGVTQARAHNNVHEIESITIGGNTTPLTHDVKGNLTTNQNGHHYTYDFDSRMSGVDTDGVPATLEITFAYDALGRRVKIGSETGVYTGQQLIARYDVGAIATNPNSQFVFASYIDEPIYIDDHTNSAGYFYHRNRQYSISALTDSTGAVVERYTYDAYGNTTILAPNGTNIRTESAVNNPFMYTGRYNHPELSLYYFRARWYDPALGRFINRDPLGFVDGMSLYRSYFVLVGVDPSGLKSIRREVQDIVEELCKRCHEPACKFFNGCSPEQCKRDAERIARAIDNTWRGNSRFDPGPIGDLLGIVIFGQPDERAWGIYCYEWAYGFKDAIDLSIDGTCFSAQVEQAKVRDGSHRVHFWVKLTSTCSGKEVYLDDGFWDGKYAHVKRPCGVTPSGVDYEYCEDGQIDVPRESCKPAEAHAWDKPPLPNGVLLTGPPYAIGY